MWQNELNHKSFNKRVVPWAFPKAGRLLSIYIKSRVITSCTCQITSTRDPQDNKITIDMRSSCFKKLNEAPDIHNTFWELARIFVIFSFLFCFVRDDDFMCSTTVTFNDPVHGTPILNRLADKLYSSYMPSGIICLIGSCYGFWLTWRCSKFVFLADLDWPTIFKRQTFKTEASTWDGHFAGLLSTEEFVISWSRRRWVDRCHFSFSLGCDL